MAKVVIGVDPHKLAATIEAVDDHETVVAKGRFGTDKASSPGDQLAAANSTTVPPCSTWCDTCVTESHTGTDMRR